MPVPLQASALRLSRPSAQRNFLDGTTAADRAKLPTPTRPQATRPCAHAHLHHPLGGLAGDLGGQVKSAA